MLTSDAIGRAKPVRHGFFTRLGGVSDGFYASLNCGGGSKDDPDKVAENRARALRALDARDAAFATVYQVHSAEVVLVDRPFVPAERPKADAMVSATPGLALAILTADCAPVLFCDRQSGVIGAAHAGWRGALTGVVEATVGAMAGLGAEPGRIAACVGPTIGQRSYQVGPEFPEPFLAQDDGNRRFFAASARAGHFMFDLPGYVSARLVAAGVGTIDDLARDTGAEPALFFSYRRTSLAGEADYGRQLSAIALTD